MSKFSEYFTYIKAKYIKIGTVQIDEISTDGTMAGNSDLCVPTEKAVKTYVGTMGVAGAATGDMMYYTGAAWAVLTAGSSGDTLTISAEGIPEWTSA